MLNAKTEKLIPDDLQRRKINKILSDSEIQRIMLLFSPVEFRSKKKKKKKDFYSSLISVLTFEKMGL